MMVRIRVRKLATGEIVKDFGEVHCKHSAQALEHYWDKFGEDEEIIITDLPEFREGGAE